MAQLGARLHGMQKVASSSLAGSSDVKTETATTCRYPSRDGAVATQG